MVYFKSEKRSEEGVKCKNLVRKKKSLKERGEASKKTRKPVQALTCTENGEEV